MSDRSRSSSPASQRSRSSSKSSKSRSRSRSRSFSSSSSSSPRFVSATDSDSDKVKSDASGSPRRKVRTKKSSPKHEASDSEAEEEPETKRRPKKGSSAATLKKGKKKKDDHESEEGEISSNDSAKEEFDDGLDEEYIGDSEDRARLEKMTEREREEEIFKRAENREAEKKRFEIQKKLKKEHKLKAKETPVSEPGDDHDHVDNDDEIIYNNVENTKDRSKSRKEKMEEKKFDQKSSALSELKAKRQEKERKDAERHKKEVAKEEKKRQRSSSSSSSAGSGSERRRSSSSSRSSSEGDSDTERFKKSPSKVQKYIETQEDLEPIRLSRFKMEKFVHLPFFKKLVMNCFVRIGIGQYQGRSVYRAAEIVDVVETGKVYFVGKIRTNIGTKLKFGKEERVFRLEFISNQRISPQEFVKWKEACADANLTLPTIESVKAKEKEIKKALNYSFTSEDVDKMVAQKEKFQRNPVNYAMHKARLIKDKDIAVANGEDVRAKEMEAKLNELEERAEELDKKRTHTISSVSLINDRNRKANVEKAESAIRLEIKKKAEGGFEENPFQRKRSTPRLVTKSNVAAASAAIASSAANPSNKSSANDKSAEQKENLVKCAETTITMKRKPDDNENKNNEESSGKDEPKAKKKAKLGSGLPLSMQKEDLFDAHNFDIEIDVDTNLIGNPNPGAAGAPMVAPINLKPTSSERAPAKRSLNLDDYKKKRGLI